MAMSAPWGPDYAWIRNHSQKVIGRIAALNRNEQTIWVRPIEESPTEFKYDFRQFGDAWYYANALDRLVYEI